MPRLFFVDDDGPLLRALERMMRLYRDCECHFEADPVRALARLDAVAPDALVADMLMPGMDGTELLTRAAERRPVMARFILSGEVGTGALVRMARAAHQCLAKPCRGEVLVDVFRRSLAGFDATRDVDASLFSVPGLAVPASAVADLRRLLCLPDDAARDAAAIALIERTAGLGAKVLQVASWTRLGLGAPPLNVSEAYFQLGADALRGLAEADLFTPDLAAVATPFQADIWQRAARAGALAETMASTEGYTGDDVRLVALCATWRASAPLLLDAAARAQYETVRLDAARHGRPMADAERDAFGRSALEALAQMLRLWGVSPEIIALIEPESDVPAADRRRRPLSLIASDAAVRTTHLGDEAGARDEGPDTADRLLVANPLAVRADSQAVAAGER